MQLNADVQVYGYYMFKDGQEARVAYPVDGVPEAHCLPGGEIAGRSFHNGCFVQRLRQAAASCPGIALRQASVRKLLNGASNTSWTRLSSLGWCGQYCERLATNTAFAFSMGK